ncbi:hypothetical protein DRJ12_04635 [Candidatus Acetothermia bacterium]|nr:MAG: hypothetical protein DRJ12_04635 [Candidatus Acetothermia bacterium]
MRVARFCLLIGAAILVAVSLSGCLMKDTRPEALFTASRAEQVVPFTVSFDGTPSYKPNGKIASYLWTFGDGASDTGPVVDHTYIEDGDYEVRLTVIDDEGYSTSSTLTVHALNPLPKAEFSYAPKSNMEGEYVVGASEWITFDGTESTDDGEVLAYDWNFGDGTTDSGPVVEHRYLYPGTYNVVLTVTDNDGGKSNYVEKVAIVGGPPCNADITGDVTWDSGGEPE